VKSCGSFVRLGLSAQCQKGFGYRQMLGQAARRVARIAGRIDGGLIYHVGPPWVNRLGYQVFRTLYRRAAWRVRSLPVAGETSEWVQVLERDGCVAIPDFLPAPAFEEVRREYLRSRESLQYDRINIEDNDVVEEMADIHRYPESFPIIRATVVENVVMRSIVAGALHRPMGVRPRAWVKHWYKASTPQTPSGLDGHVMGVNYLHADVHYPTFKAFLYLSDTDESNGAFTYALGSHRLTLARLAFEYESSVQVAVKRRDDPNLPKYYGILKSPSEEQCRRMNVDCTSVVGKANTLIIANTHGFHRQGEFKEGAVREAIMFCFRTAEPGFRFAADDPSAAFFVPKGARSINSA
jgi:hypothetical protein